MQIPANFLSDSKDVLLLFVIPIGGGIPAGVVLAKARGLSWLMMLFLYFISDVILACVFEPIMLLFIHASGRNPKLAKIRSALSEVTAKTVSKYGLNPRPFSIVMITFGTDPMTGRAVAKAAGHGFLVGWLLTIMGDMIYFSVLMVSTLWLSDVLGDGTWAVIVIMVIMMVAPAIVRKIRQRLSARSVN